MYNHIIPGIGGHTKLQSITSEDLINMIKKIEYPSVKEQCMKITKNLFAFARSKNYIRFNPAILAYKTVKTDFITCQKREVSIYSIDQVKLLLHTCQMNFQDMYIPLLLSLCVGTRISETLALKYSDIDFEHERIYITKQLGRSFVNDEASLKITSINPKTRNGTRIVPVPRWVLDELIVQKAQYENLKINIRNFTDNDLICCCLDGTSYNRGRFHKDFHTLLSMCGLPDMHWHDMRHIYASLLKNNQVNMKAVSEFLGHASSKFTDEVYTHSEEIAYDCSILQEFWDSYESCRPKKEAEINDSVLKIPLTDKDLPHLIL